MSTIRKRPLKIAVYSGEIPSTTFIEQLITGLAGEQVDIYLFGKRRDTYRNHDRNVQIYPTPRTKFGLIVFVIVNLVRLILKSYSDFRLLRKHIASFESQSISLQLRKWGNYLPVLIHRPDIFHIQWAKAAPEWIFLQELFGIRIVLSLRGAHINYSPIADPKLAKRYKAIFPSIKAFHAVSKNIAEEAMKYGAERDRIRIIYSGLKEENLISLSPSRTTELRQGSSLNIISVGRHHWKKGYSYAIDAMQILKSWNVVFTYKIIAGGHSEEIQYMIKDSPLEQSVELLDRMPQDQVFRYISEADIFLLSSVEEGIANVVIEAMALGTKVVSTNCGGMSELIEHRVNGFLVPVRKPVAIATAIKDCSELSSIEEEKLIESARKKVQDQHSVEKLIQGMMSLYQSTIL